jgi:filamentous hemagglutinin family protein
MPPYSKNKLLETTWWVVFFDDFQKFHMNYQRKKIKTNLLIPAFIFSLLPSPGIAQITPDNTLPINSKIETQCTNCVIEGGTIRGVNLFHSFEKFSIPENGKAFFNNETSIQNIFTRVTGKTVSNIDGEIGANGKTNLFFLNPNGISFGANARLNLSGSFFATTADSFKFPDGSNFGITNVNELPLLTVTVTPGLGLIQSQESINTTGNLSGVQDLTLAAYQLNLEGNLEAGGNIRLVSEKPVYSNSEFTSTGNFSIHHFDNSLGSIYTNRPVTTIHAGGDVSFHSYEGPSLKIIAGGAINIPGHIQITQITPTSLLLNSTLETVTLSNQEIINIDTGFQPTLDIRAGSLAGGKGGESHRGDINLGEVTFDYKTSDIVPEGVVLLTNQYQPNLSLIGANIHVNQIGTFNNNSPSDGDIPINNISLNDITTPESGRVILDSRDNIQIVNGGIDTSSQYSNAGHIKLLADKNITIDNSTLTTAAKTFGISSGYITINADSLNLKNNSTIDLSQNSIVKKTIRQIMIDESNPEEIIQEEIIQKEIIQEGDFESGYVEQVQDDSGSNTKERYINQSILPLLPPIIVKDSGGSLIINTKKYTSIENSEIIANGNFYGSQSIDINAENLYFDKSSIIINSSTSDEKAGNINLNIVDNLSLKNDSSISSFSQSGSSGDINIKTNSLNLSQSRIKNDSLPGSFQTVTTGSINIYSNQLNINDNSLIEIKSVPTSDKIGTLTLQGRDTSYISEALITKNSRISSRVTDGTEIKGKEGNSSGFNILKPIGAIVKIQANKLILDNNSHIVAENAYQPKDKLPDVYQLPETQDEIKLTDTVSEVLIDAHEINLTNNSRISASAYSSDGGNVIFNPGKSLFLDNSEIVAFVQSKGTGGNIVIPDFESLKLTNNSLISAQTPDGHAGNIFINTSKDIILDSGSAINALAIEGSAGSIQVTTGNLLLQNGATLNVTSNQGEAGTLDINVNNLFLNRGYLVAETDSKSEVNGANINIKVRDLLSMKNSSRISAEALNQAKGGNINIDATNGFIIAVASENNDIVASAVQGNGGNITIKTQGIIGLQQHTSRTSLSDITASSQFGVDGNISISQVETTPTQGLVELPNRVTDTTNQVAQGCNTAKKQENSQNRFIVTGKGSLPESPSDFLSGGLVSSNLIDTQTTLDLSSTTHSGISIQDSDNSTVSKSKQISIIEAQGWLIDKQGNISLVTHTESISPNSPPMINSRCNSL